MFNDALILVFAKTPIVGKVKTRLIPAVGEHAANRIHRSLLLHTMRTMDGSPVVPLQLWCAPDCDNEIFTRLEQKYGITLHEQSGRDLGERMYFALREALTIARKVIIIGSDCAVLNKEHIVEMLKTLDSFDATIIPASDGGYVAMGLRCLDESLFQGIDWGTESVLGQTRNRLDRLGWRYKLQHTLWDIDRPEDLERLLQAHLQKRTGGEAQLSQEVFSPALLELLLSKLRLSKPVPVRH